MQRIHLHKPVWIHPHKPDWHAFGTQLDHMVHDARFWTVVGFIVLVGVMIALAFLAQSGMSTDRPLAPVYPYPPYLP
ncbi:MAG: hypothetical protein ACO3BO_08715 [Anaerohalosphaeraceae bacterium]